MGGAGEESGYPKQDYGAYYGGDEVADDASGSDAEKAEKPAAEHTSDYAYDKVDDPAEATASHKFAGYGAGCNSDEYIPDEAHSEMILEVVFSMRFLLIKRT